MLKHCQYDESQDPDYIESRTGLLVFYGGTLKDRGVFHFIFDTSITRPHKIYPQKSISNEMLKFFKDLEVIS